MPVRLLLLLAAAPLLIGSAREMGQARADVRAAQADLLKLERAAARAKGEADRLAAQRQAAAAAITASEAAISAADARLKLANGKILQQERRIAERRAPAAALVAGVISMGRRPPILGLADSASLDEFIRVRALLDTTLPAIRARTADLSAELEASRRLRAEAALARDGLAKESRLLEQRRQKFAALEASANRQASALGASAIGASDVLTASSESAARAMSDAQRRRAELALAAELGSLPPSPPRPGPIKPARPVLAYMMPASVHVDDGLGSVSDTGIRSRGIMLRTYPGQPVVVPANGRIAFAGPFRRHDGVVIIDHGGGWMTLMTGVRSDLRKGARVERGEPLGRALGPLNLELSTNGRPVSAALIAGSSQLLFIGRKSG